MANFYKKQRKRYNILLDSNDQPTGGKWSFDDQNRKKLPKNISLPDEFKIEFEKVNKFKYDLVYQLRMNQ